MIAALESLGVAVGSFEADRRIVEVTLELPHGARAEEIVGTVGELEGVRAVRWSP